MKTKPRTTFSIPQEVHQAIVAVLTYLWHDEETDYLAGDEDYQQKHIFEELRKIRDWLMHIKKSS